MATLDPFNLPEISSLIARNLSKHDLGSCLSVCRVWHNALLPHLWSDIDVKPSLSEQSLRNPDPNVLKRYSYFVKNLEIRAFSFKEYVMPYPNLQALNFVITNDCSADLLSVNTSITHLTFNDQYYLEAIENQELWRAVADLPHLTTLIFDFGTTISAFDMSDFWLACTRLDRLFIFTSNVDCSVEIPDGMVFSRMQELVLQEMYGTAPKDNLELIRRCPYLKRLTWYSVVDDDLEHAAMEFVRLAKNRAWPNLESLGIRIGLGDDDMATVLENISFVTKLESDYSSFGLTSFTAMKRSFGMLRDLNVSNCPNMSSWMVQELLSSCPRLEVFMGDFLEAEDVLGGQPWVCLSIRVLKVCFTFRTGQSLMPAIYERLSHLTRLTSLNVGHELKGVRLSQHQGLDIQLEAGLGLLAKLKYLEYFGARDLSGSPGLKEIEWMAGNWRSLVALRCRPQIEPEKLSKTKWNFWFSTS
ncbi:hypothetical protein BGX20_005881 [Mortierella sp. AD010]|nr:hypothetical protein BGX20_005881 [Mortierella sp. AD010]